jgi:surface carbohydrate biosynthesis protein
MNAYILTEITKRELDSNLLLALIAAKNNFNILISNMDTLEYLIKKNFLKKGIFHTKSILHDEKKNQLHENLNSKGFKITSVDEENGLIEKNLEIFCKTRFSNSSLKLVDKIFCWGPHDYRYLKKHYTKYKSKFIPTGTHRIDLWKKKFISYWMTDKKIKKSPKNVIISLNFGLTNGHETFKKKIKKLKNAKYFERSKNLKKLLYQIKEENIRDINRFKILINYLSKKIKEINFIVRPHPNEKLSTWKKILHKNNNVIIDNKENFNEALNKSSLLIHKGCTTAFQASMIDIPVISYVGKSMLSSHGVTANNLGIKVNDKKKVEIFIRKILIEKNKINLNTNKILKHKLFLYKKNLSSKEIVNQWKNIHKNIIFNNNNWNKIKVYLFFHDLKKLFHKDYKFEKINLKIILKL